SPLSDGNRAAAGRARLDTIARGSIPFLLMSTALSGMAYGQSAADDPDAAASTSDGQTTALQPIPVEGAGTPANRLQATTGLSRLPGTIQDLPQTVNVISQETLQQQGVSTLDQALQNVPGVTVAIGEGNGGLNGDQFRIRGFQAKGDIY